MIRLIQADSALRTSEAPWAWALGAMALGLSALGCDPGGVGDPCTPEDEYRQQVPGYAVTEVNVESRSFQCETRVCLVNHFQGRVSCPYGQTPEEATECMGGGDCSPNNGKGCRVPGTDGQETNNGQFVDRIEVAVAPQLIERSADDAVYCSCRCDGDDENARYCECPSGFACVELVEDLGLGADQLAGSYCIKEGTRYNTQQSVGMKCDKNAKNCGNEGRNP